MEYIFALLKSGSPDQEKRGLQAICALLEKGILIQEEDKAELLRDISKFKLSNNVILRRWLYKVIGLLNQRHYISYLKSQLYDHETDEENRTWITAAIYRLLEKKEASAIIRASSVDSILTQLSSGFYEPIFLPKSIKTLSQIIDDNNEIGLKWLGLIYGNASQNIPVNPVKLKDLITRLNLHDDPIVAEYSIWALQKAPFCRYSDCLIPPQDIASSPPNVRRWLYRLITNDIQTINSNYDLIKDRIQSETDISAREGLAIGLSKFANEEFLVPIIGDWFKSEKNPIVRIQLLIAIAKNADHIQIYNNIVINEREAPCDSISELIVKGLNDMKQIDKMPKTHTILIVVATETEAKILYDCFEKNLQKPRSFLKENMTFWDLGTIRNSEIVLVKCGMGSSSVGGSLMTVSYAINLLHPKYVIMVGIGFGLREGKQELGEIMISRQLHDYDLEKITETDHSSRADNISSHPDILTKFESSFLIWKGVKLHFGLVISGQKLSNNKEFVESLKLKYPEAIGGEMEGTGLQSASYRENIHWILIKGICDWGYDKTDEYQETAAKNAVEYLLFTLQNIEF